MAKTRKKTKTRKPGGAVRTAKPSAAPDARLAAADPKQLAVVNAVNSAMDANQQGWNSDGNGDNRTMSSFGYVVNSIKPFLNIVARLLQPTYTLAVDKMNLATCVSATVLGLKGLVLQNTK